MNWDPVTYEEVEKAADAIEAEGGTASYSAIRERLGKQASHVEIGNHLAARRRKLHPPYVFDIEESMRSLNKILAPEFWKQVKIEAAVRTKQLEVELAAQKAARAAAESAMADLARRVAELEQAQAAAVEVPQ